MEFIKSIIYAAMLSEAVLLIMPSGATKKYVKLAAGIMITLMVLMPLSSCSIENMFSETKENVYESSDITAGEIIAQAYNEALQNND